MEPVQSAGNVFGATGCAGKRTVHAKERKHLCKQKKTLMPRTESNAVNGKSDSIPEFL